MDNSGTVGSISQARVSPWGLLHSINLTYIHTLLQSQAISPEKIIKTWGIRSCGQVTVQYKAGEALSVIWLTQSISSRTRFDVS